MKASVSSILCGASAASLAALEGRGVGAVAAHAVVQARAAGREAFRLGVVDAVDQAHELAHHVAMEPGRAEGVLGDHPARREDHEVDSWPVPGVSDGEVSTVKIDGSG